MDKTLLTGKKALVVGIANDSSIAYGCARMLKTAGADLAITYLNEKAKPFIDKIAEELQPSIYTACDVTTDDLEQVFLKINQKFYTSVPSEIFSGYVSAFRSLAIDSIRHSPCTIFIL